VYTRTQARCVTRELRRVAYTIHISRSRLAVRLPACPRPRAVGRQALQQPAQRCDRCILGVCAAYGLLSEVRGAWRVAIAVFGFYIRGGSLALGRLILLAALLLGNTEGGRDDKIDLHMNLVRRAGWLAHKNTDRPAPPRDVEQLPQQVSLRVPMDFFRKKLAEVEGEMLSSSGGSAEGAGTSGAGTAGAGAWLQQAVSTATSAATKAFDDLEASQAMGEELERVKADLAAAEAEAALLRAGVTGGGPGGEEARVYQAEALARGNDLRAIKQSLAAAMERASSAEAHAAAAEARSAAQEAKEGKLKSLLQRLSDAKNTLDAKLKESQAELERARVALQAAEIAAAGAVPGGGPVASGGSQFAGGIKSAADTDASAWEALAEAATAELEAARRQIDELRTTAATAAQEESSSKLQLQAALDTVKELREASTTTAKATATQEEEEQSDLKLQLQAALDTIEELRAAAAAAESASGAGAAAVATNTARDAEERAEALEAQLEKASAERDSAFRQLEAAGAELARGRAELEKASAARESTVRQLEAAGAQRDEACAQVTIAQCRRGCSWSRVRVNG